MNAPSPLATTFNTDETNAESRPLVNFVWGNMVKAGKNGAPECLIPLDNIRRAIDNANKYPGADFNIWIDHDFLDDSTLFWLDSVLYAEGKNSNVTFHNLRDIPDYANNSFFDSEQTYNSRYHITSVYGRADYARILVLDHCMKTEPNRDRIYYSDMDSTDIRLNETEEVIKREGLVTTAITMAGAEHVPHNGFIGIAPHAPAIKAHFAAFVQNTADLMKSHNGAMIKDLGYKSFAQFLNDIGIDYANEHNRVAIDGIVPNPHTHIPESDLVEALGVNKYNFK